MTATYDPFGPQRPGFPAGRLRRVGVPEDRVRALAEEYEGLDQEQAVEFHRSIRRASDAQVRDRFLGGEQLPPETPPPGDRPPAAGRRDDSGPAPAEAAPAPGPAQPAAADQGAAAPAAPAPEPEQPEQPEQPAPAGVELPTQDPAELAQQPAVQLRQLAAQVGVSAAGSKPAVAARIVEAVTAPQPAVTPQAAQEAPPAPAPAAQPQEGATGAQAAAQDPPAYPPPPPAAGPRTDTMLIAAQTPTPPAGTPAGATEATATAQAASGQDTARGPAPQQQEAGGDDDSAST